MNTQITSQVRAFAQRVGARADAVRQVHYNVDGELPLHVYSVQADGLVWLWQGGDLIGIPLEDFGEFHDELEHEYAS